jgi:peptide-methionine (S)-S-oxide reductase
VLGTQLRAEVPEGCEVAYFAMGCFWGAEKCFWGLDGVVSTAVGYMGGVTKNPSYYEVCRGRSGHAESVRVIFDPKKISYEDLLVVFFENHDPTQGDRQGNDVGDRYRSALFTTSPEQVAPTARVETLYGATLSRVGRRAITTEIVPAGEFYFAEDEHQQYLVRNPGGYCPNHSTGIACSLV